MTSLPPAPLLRWYKHGTRREMPWRQTQDAYHIWLSEIMLQQTQVDTVIPYYKTFLQHFPTVNALAEAPVEEVLASWSGLGYYTRAKNLHKAAQQVVDQYGGRLPQSVEELLSLSGIGQYTAGAIASIAYQIQAPVVDGNVIRVFTRYFGIRKDPQEPKVLKQIWQLAHDSVPAKRPGDFNQAIMDLGALVCTPSSPDCPKCPLKTTCVAFSKSLQEKIPPPRKAVARKQIRYTCCVLEQDGKVLIARRPTTGLLPGLWEFPGGEIKGTTPLQKGLESQLKKRLGLELSTQSMRKKIRQLLTHRELHIHAYKPKTTEWERGSKLSWYTQTKWVPIASLKKQPLTTGMKQLAQQLFPSA